VGARVGVIGTGNIGFGMCCNLLNAGFEVTAHDIRPEPLQALREKGASIGSNAGAVGRECPIVFSVVFDYPQNLAILEGPDGLLENMAPGGCIFVCGTISPDHARELAALATARNLRLLDCPVSGGRGGAEAGTLTLMIGGDRNAVEEHRAALEAVSGNIYYMGDVGRGEVAKVVNNLLSAVSIVATAEALLLASKSGVNLKQMYSVIMASTGRSWGFEHRALRMIDRDFDTRGALKLLLKDTGIAMDVANALSLPMPLTSVVRQIFQIAVNQGLGDDDISTVVKVMEQAAGFSLTDAER